jgi:ribosomal protein L35
MIRKLSLASVLVGALLLSGCGGSKDIPTEITENSKIIIIKDLSKVICEHSSFKKYLPTKKSKKFLAETTGKEYLETAEFKNIQNRTKESSINCDTYNKSEENCDIILFSDIQGSLSEDISDYEDSSAACLITFDI